MKITIRYSDGTQESWTYETRKEGWRALDRLRAELGARQISGATLRIG